MYKGRSIVALIPARGGSKGLPRKNIRILLNKPLIAWAIGGARKSRLIDRVIISTDDEEIKCVSEKYGGEAPFLRPKELAQDRSRAVDVIMHALNWIERAGQSYDAFILLQPTSPLRTETDINAAIKIFVEKKAKAVVSVCETEHHPYLSNTLPNDKCMKDFIKSDAMNKNRQELPKYYRLNGAIFMADCGYFRKGRSFYGKNTYAYVMPQERSVDIDGTIDLKFAECLLKEQKRKD